MKTLEELSRAKRLYVRCPSCESSFAVSSAHLFDATKRLPAFAAEHLDAERRDIGVEKARLRHERSELSRRSFTSTATGGVGQILEMISASLPGLPAAPQDCRALLKPIDYIAFSGSSSGEVHAIAFIEAKTGRQRLSAIQRTIKNTVEDGKVSLRIADHRLDTE